MPQSEGELLKISGTEGGGEKIYFHSFFTISLQKIYENNQFLSVISNISIVLSISEIINNHHNQRGGFYTFLREGGFLWNSLR